MKNKNNQQLLLKSQGVAFLLWFFFGMLGANRYYVGHKKEGIIMSIVFVIAFIPPLYPLFFIVGIWCLLNFFRFWGNVKNYNLAILNKKDNR